jgi:hypothetical protein
MSRPWMNTMVLAWQPRREVGDLTSDGGWWAGAAWFCGAFGKPGYIDGHIGTRYPSGMTQAIDYVMDVAKRLGIEVRGTMALFVEGDGENPDVLPVNWREKVREEAARRGWQSYSERKKSK